MAIPVAVVGLGRRGLQWCAEIGRSGAFEVAAGCDPSSEARRAAAGAGLPPDRVFPSFREARARVGVRAAVVASSVDDHVAPCAEAIEAGLAVLVEKPFALSVCDARRLVDLAGRHGRPLGVGQNFRYLRVFRAARAVIAGGQLGAVRFAAMSSYREGHAPVGGLDGLPGAALWETGIHHLDIVRFLFGGEVASVSASVAGTTSHEAHQGTTWAVNLELADGPLVSYRLSWDSRGHGAFERGQQFGARVVGELGTLHILQRWLVLCRPGRWPRVLRRGPRARTEESALLDDLARAMDAGGDPPVSGADNLHTIALVQACLQSARERRHVDPRRLLEGS
jgi:predicted dehydrogenase